MFFQEHRTINYKQYMAEARRIRKEKEATGKPLKYKATWQLAEELAKKSPTIAGDPTLPDGSLLKSPITSTVTAQADTTTPTTPDVPITPEPTRTERERDYAAAIGADEGIQQDIADDPETAGERTMQTEEERLLEQDIQRGYRGRQEERQESLLQSTIRTAKEQAAAAQAAGEAQFAEGREGATTSSAPAAAGRFSKIIQRRVTSAQTRYDSAIDSLNENKRRLERTEDAETKARIRAIIRQQEIDANNAEAAMLAVGEQSNADFVDLMEQKSIDAIANMNVNDVIGWATSMGASEALATAYHASAVNEKETSKLEGKKLSTLEQADYDYKIAQTKKLKADITKMLAPEISKAEENIRNYQMVQGALGRGEIPQEVADNMLKEMGMLDEPPDSLAMMTQKAQLELTQAKTETEKANARTKLYDLQEQQALTTSGTDIMNTIANMATGIVPQRAPGQDQQYQGQCAAFINDVVGTPGKYGTTLESKTRNINSQTPSVGSIFVSSIGNDEIGHCGFVEDVNFEDGTVTLFDSNRYSDKKTNRRTVPFSALETDEKIIGYENVAQSAKSEGGAKNGLYTKFLQKAESVGLSGEEAKKFAGKRLEESFKPMTETQGKAFKAIVVAQAENELIGDVMRDVDLEEFADSINVLTREIGDPDSLLFGETVNQAISDPKIRNAILSEMRWIGAILREESGAAISIQEYINKGTQFYPRAGDDIETIKNKEIARAREVEALKGKIGASGERVLTELAEQQQEEERLDAQAQQDADFISGESQDIITAEDIPD